MLADFNFMESCTLQTLRSPCIIPLFEFEENVMKQDRYSKTNPMDAYSWSYIRTGDFYSYLCFHES